MNKLEVTQFGVQELNAKEMVEVEGGIPPLIIGGLILIGVLWPKEAK